MAAEAGAMELQMFAADTDADRDGGNWLLTIAAADASVTQGIDAAMLANCPDCGAEAAEYAKIRSCGGGAPYARKDVSVECTRCGFVLTVQTRGNPAMICRLWNVAA